MKCYRSFVLLIKAFFFFYPLFYPDCVNASAIKAFNSLPYDIFLDWAIVNAFADDNLNVATIMISVFDWVENIVGKGGNDGDQYFILFTQCFLKASF